MAPKRKREDISFNQRKWIIDYVDANPRTSNVDIAKAFNEHFEATRETPLDRRRVSDVLRMKHGIRAVESEINGETKRFRGVNRRHLCGMVKSGNKEIMLLPEKIPSVGLASIDALSFEGDLLTMGIFEEELAVQDKNVSINSDSLRAVDKALGGIVSEILAEGEFKGKPGSSQFLRVGKKCRYFGLMGLGAKEKATGDALASLFSKVGEGVACAAKANKCAKCGFNILGGIDESAGSTVAEFITRGLVLGGYESTRFKKEPKESKLASLELLQLVPETKYDEIQEIIKRTEIMTLGTFMTRYLVEAPANICTPTYLAETAKSIADANPQVMKLEVLEKDDCEKLGMGCYLGVAAAADTPPKFIHLTYTPAQGDVKQKVALVGKGVTFDSGGYNIKTQMMELMKFDMGGSGAVIGAAQIISQLQPPGVEVHFIVAACENMISGTGIRPSDVLTASNGTTVEIGNTDAEGRLTLADALIFAQENCQVKKVIDVATLTGAIIVGLGPAYAATYSDSDSMIQDIEKASKMCCEKVWRMPLEESYEEYNKSKIADVSNSPSSRWGGSIAAALFLKKFVDPEKMEWGHIDMAGPVWNHEKGYATGWGAQLLAEWAIIQGQ